SEGTRWTRCGHFQPAKIIMIVDCHKFHCERSQLHSRGCTARTCSKTFGPQIEQDVERVNDLCRACRVALGKAASRLPLPL
ncbi:hypothetical protein C8F01DRAFT_997474, partial [Mycena amicta]